jgi:hypothetical protein
MFPAGSKLTAAVPKTGIARSFDPSRAARTTSDALPVPARM